MKVEVKIYKDNLGGLHYSPQNYEYLSQDWEKYLMDTEQNERLERLKNMRSKDRTPKIYRLRKTPTFLKWSEENKVSVTSELFAICEADVDGRLNESDVRVAIMNAFQNKEQFAKVYPRCNKNKPPHLWLVYEFLFLVKYINNED